MITSMKLVFENVNALERIIDNPELLAKISEDYSRTNKLN